MAHKWLSKRKYSILNVWRSVKIFWPCAFDRLIFDFWISRVKWAGVDMHIDAFDVFKVLSE